MTCFLNPSMSDYYEMGWNTYLNIYLVAREFTDQISSYIWMSNKQPNKYPSIYEMRKSHEYKYKLNEFIISLNIYIF